MSNSVIEPDKEKLTLQKIIKEVTARGNDVQITHSPNGIKIFEVQKKLVAIIKN